ncbi:putative phage abortive infection protein [Maricaulis salignorans]|uniref:Putative phage abortive infection protein n=1 Tax=Maricaulis salignorans TaxID=144026 RepID=A0A1G9W1D2_9PROT|nr:putative phage abortive infection protein [Maricaulis salignorans]SDM78338.1 Putative phage abortive infection protein [Maricaulis salignorans]
MSKDQDEVDDVKTPSTLLIWLVAGGVILAWAASLLLLFFSPTSRGTFGDMFGAANALFSGFALAGVIYAILLQRSEISVARKELRHTRDILSDQQDHLRKQNFEGTFFQLLRILTEITAQIDLASAKSVTSGKDALKVFHERALSCVLPTAQKLAGGHDFDEGYKTFYQQNGHELGHYFRTLYNIIKFIDQSDVQNKNFYTNLVRAQLSDREAALLYLNGLSTHGSEKFKPLIERYKLLKNVDKKHFIHSEVRARYDDAAFGN